MKKNTSVRGLILISLMSLVPLVALAAPGYEVTTGINTFGSIIGTFTQSIVRALATLFATAAMAAFFFGIVQFLWGSRDADPTKMKNGKNFMVWGLVALFVMFSVWGIIIYVQQIFKIDGKNTIIIPDIKIQESGSAPAPSPLGTSPGGLVNGCTTVGTACTVNGSAGTCLQGGSARDYAVYCSANASGGNTGGAGGTGGNTNYCSTIDDEFTCESMNCLWDDGGGCSQ